MNNESRSPVEIWETLSPHAKELCQIIIVPGTEEMLRATFVKDEGYDLNAMLQELRSAGVIETTSYIQEAQKIVEKFTPTRNLAGPSVVFTEEERAWRNAKSTLEEYERGKDSDPGFKHWIKPQFKVKDEFQSLVPNF